MAQEIADSKLIDTWSSSGNIVKPDISKIIEGWQLGEQPPHEYMNWLQNIFGSKLNHILKNGVASWNNETPYLAGSSVQHNGNVWLCKTTNTDSDPTDANANWKRIITVESLTTVLNGYVKNTGDETIGGVKTFSSNPLSTATQSTNSNALTKYSAVVKNTGDETIGGVKTFSSSPIVPTPTIGTQAANKDYVDSVATLDINALTAKTTPIDTDNLAIQETGGLLKKLSFANLVNWIKSFSFGWGQTWQNMTASRSVGVTYTNTTGRPIQILAQYQDSGTGGATFMIGNLSRTTEELVGGAAYPFWFSAVIPNGVTYRISGGVDLPAWWELR